MTIHGGVLVRPVEVELIRPGILVCETWKAPITQDERWENPAEFLDFMTRLGEAEAIKRMMRAGYAKQAKPRSFEEMLRESRDFWASYQEVNDRLVPEDPVYSKVTAGTALSTTNDLFEFGAASAGQSRVLEFVIAGEATSSAANRTTFNRVTSQGTGTAPTSYTPEKFSTRSPAAAGTYYGGLTAVVTWGTAQATLAANPLLSFAINAFGGSDRWVAQPGEEIYLVNAEFASHRSASGTSVVSSYAVVEEM